jgi:osmotically-inducible protein OsmY
METSGNDANIAVHRAITKALGRHAVAEAGRIVIHISDGQAELVGTVDSWHEHDAAIAAARRVPGIDGVIDHLVVQK